jgi:thiol-disulfide isomerase/thioredoxin
MEAVPFYCVANGQRKSSLLEMKTNMILLFVGLVLVLVGLRYMWLNREGFTSTNTSTGADTFSLFYVDWCPHCKTVKPEFQEFAKNGFITVAGKNVKVQAVECEKEPEKAAGKPIKGYPTILLEKSTGETLEYTGDRTTEAYMAYLTQQYS